MQPDSLPNGQGSITEQPQAEQLVLPQTRKKSRPFSLFLFILFVVGMILIAVGYLMSPVVAQIGITLSFASLLVYLNLRYFRKRKRSALSLISSVILSSCLFAILFFVSNFLLGILSATGFGHSNGAQAVLQPIAVQMQNFGGKEFCSEGDNGYTLDNSQPWYKAEYIFPNSPNLKNNIMKIFAAQGYSLTRNEDAVNALKESNISDGNAYDPQLNYLKGQKDGKTLSVIISPLSYYVNTPDESNDSQDCQEKYSALLHTMNSGSYIVGVEVDLTSAQ